MGTEVLVLNPMGTLVWMSSSCPSPQDFEDEVIYGAEDCLADHVPMILNPTPYDGIEQPYQVLGFGLQVGLHDVSDFPHEHLDALEGRLDEQFAVVLAYVLSEKIEPILDVRDDGFLRREFQTTLPEESLYQRFDDGF